MTSAPSHPGTLDRPVRQGERDAAADPVRAPSPLRMRWHLHRNCALSPQAFALHIGASCAALGVIGIGFAMAGYLPILALCLAQALALVLAGLIHAVHALDGEELLLSPDDLVVCTRRGLDLSTVHLHPAWTRLERMRGTQPPRLRSGTANIPVAVYLNAAQRSSFTAEFEGGLAQMRAQALAQPEGTARAPAPPRPAAPVAPPRSSSPVPAGPRPSTETSS